MKKEEIIAKYGEEAYQRQLMKNREYQRTHREELKEYWKKYNEEHKEERKKYNLKNRGSKSLWDFSDCTTKYDRMKKMNLFVEYSAEKDELMPEVSGKIDIFQYGECRDRIYLTPCMNTNGRYRVWAHDNETGKLYPIYVHEIVFYAEFGDVPKGWIIHHLDGNPLNNHPFNLVAMPRGEHGRYHRLKDRNKANEILKQYRRAQRRYHS